jgi:acetoin utilization protein AcuC
MREVIFISAPDLWGQGFGPYHPLQSERLQRTYELLEAFGVLSAPNVRVVPPRLASEDELALFHTREYISAVQALSSGAEDIPASRYGFGPGDNPVFSGMYESSGLKVGGALVGAEMIVQGTCEISFHYSGGLHHGGPDYASGFCIFNDAAIAIHWLRTQGLRVAYIDVDVHHGDGVQHAFYDNNQVLTISLHQSGRTLFPGTGFVEEIGKGEGQGFSINLPLPPFTDDETYLWAFRSIVPPLVSRFEPDVLVTQLGVDTHFLDPLASLALTTLGHEAIFNELNAMDLPWLALGGGGYNLDVVPRSWAMAFAVMSNQSFPDELPHAYRIKYGGEWLADREEPQIEDRIRSLVRRRVEEVVGQVMKLTDLG